MTQENISDEERSAALKKRMRIMLVCLIILFGGIFLYKMAMGMLMRHFMANQSELVTVSTAKVTTSPWQPKITEAGSLRAIHGVNVTTQLAGQVQSVYFTPGADVTAGTVLVQLNADDDVALLHSLQANAELSRITYARDKAQFKAEGVSKQVVDNDAANVQSLTAQVAQQAAIVAKKTIVAPFTGRLGINLINLGQYLNPGDAVTMLQTLDPIYADFNVPQQELTRIKCGQKVMVAVDAMPGRQFFGTITTINPGVDVASRNVLVEATIANPEKELAPGMFANVEVDTGEPADFVTVAQTVISYNPYGDIVYVVTEKGKDKDDKPKLIANQRFVKLGETRGEQVAVIDGLKDGETVVTSGQLKLKNGSQITVNNSVVPPDNPAPDLTDAHEASQ
ncbi:MAG: efflux RND transporter periplasmic adaptor subunit [Pseudomonadota bacterium]